MESNSIETVAAIKSSCFFYDQIPAKLLRNSVDSWFPTLAKNANADTTSGRWHRYKEGHDLLIDVNKTLLEQGPVAAFKHFGHIVLTDFPTKDGVPIPGFSRSGLGKVLEEYGISTGWVNISVYDASIGILAISEGHADLLSALSGQMDMTGGVFFDTFVEGAFEISIGVYAKNPLVVAGGIENILAGVVSSWNTISVYVDPVPFLGNVCASLVLGGIIGYGLASSQPLPERVWQSAKISSRSTVLATFFSVHSAFGFGVLLAMSAFEMSKILANSHNDNKCSTFSCSHQDFYRLIESYMERDPLFDTFLKSGIIDIDLKADVENNLDCYVMNALNDHIPQTLKCIIPQTLDCSTSQTLKCSIPQTLNNCFINISETEFNIIYCSR